MIILGKKDYITLPYVVKESTDKVILEAYGIYKEAYLVFHIEFYSSKFDNKQIYIRLNESVLREINLEIEALDYKRFNFKFDNLLEEDEIKSLVILESKVLNERTIYNEV